MTSRKKKKPRKAKCYDCSRPYGHYHGFPDLLIPDHIWERISPSKNGGGLLCPSCICKRLARRRIRCEGAFVSGPITSVPEQVMELLLRVRRLEAKLAEEKIKIKGEIKIEY